MCTLAPAGRITEAEVAEELARLTSDWAHGAATPAAGGGANDDTLLRELLGPTRLEQVGHRFDRVQLAEVVRTCRRADSLSAAGRELFAASDARAKANDADRLRKYLARFGLMFDGLA